ncbi:hypothetical protein D9613_009213 [Agrocybe pediades]|uniref:Uncharacterized protein n=1 Tax=Agrocybe pediades TaxID=84607 RepID=A0A8H4R5L1_9AGAR|nr:hypothetical protein D9613_009213 [Agrocybe pediades]
MEWMLLQYTPYTKRRWKEEGRDEEGNRTRSTSNVVRSTTHAGRPPLSATSPAATHAHPFTPTLERHVTTRNRAATSRVTQPPMQRVNADMRPSPPLRTSAATSPQPRKSKRPIPRHVNPSPHIEPRHVTVVNSCRPTPCPAAHTSYSLWIPCGFPFHSRSVPAPFPGFHVESNQPKKVFNPVSIARGEGLNALIHPDAASLALVFPVPLIPHVPILSEIGREGLSRFLIIWNLPGYQLWDQVINWINSVLKLVKKVHLLKVSRSNEAGQQVFWLAFQNHDDASTFRGQVAGRVAAGGHPIACDFVSADEYSAVAGSKPPTWIPGSGFSDGINGSSPLTTLELVRQPNASLADRLGILPNTTAVWTHRKARRGKRKPQRQQDPADGGAL